MLIVNIQSVMALELVDFMGLHSRLVLKDVTDNNKLSSFLQYRNNCYCTNRKVRASGPSVMTIFTVVIYDGL
jgi:hypothetical protein